MYSVTQASTGWSGAITAGDQLAHGISKSFGTTCPRVVRGQRSSAAGINIHLLDGMPGWGSARQRERRGPSTGMRRMDLVGLAHFLFAALTVIQLFVDPRDQAASGTPRVIDRQLAAAGSAILCAQYPGWRKPGPCSWPLCSCPSAQHMTRAGSLVTSPR